MADPIYTIEDLPLLPMPLVRRVNSDGTPTKEQLDFEGDLRNFQATFLGFLTQRVDQAEEDIDALETSVSDITVTLVDIQADVAGNTAAILVEANARASADAAEASLRAALAVQVGTNTAGLAAELIVRANADSALSASITALTTTVNGHTATLVIYGASINGIEVQYGVLGSINGVTGGYTISGVGKLDGTASFAIEFLASTFTLYDPGLGPSALPVFTYDGGLGAMVFNVPVILNYNNLETGSVGNIGTNSSSAFMGSCDVNLTTKGTGWVEIYAQFFGQLVGSTAFEGFLLRVTHLESGTVLRDVIISVGLAPVTAGPADYIFLPTNFIVPWTGTAGSNTFRLQILKYFDISLLQEIAGIYMKVTEIAR